jgi:hypothetical protein
MGMLGDDVKALFTLARYATLSCMRIDIEMRKVRPLALILNGKNWVDALIVNLKGRFEQMLLFWRACQPHLILNV